MPATTRAVAPAVAPAAAPEAVALVASRQQIIAAIGIFTSLLAAGSCGLIGHPLRHAGTLVALLAICAAAFPSGAGSLRRIGMLALFAVLAGYLSTSTSTIVSTLGVLTLICGITVVHPESLRTLRPVCVAIFVFALYRLAHDSIPIVWELSNIAGKVIGLAGGAIAGSPLSTGATFSGLDALVLMSSFAAAWISQTPRARLTRAIYLLSVIILAHLLYLFALARLNFDPALTPWNVPILAAILHAIVVVFVLRWG